VLLPLNNKINTNKHDIGQKAAVKEVSDHSDVDMFAPPLQFTGIVSTDEVGLIKMTLL